MGRSAPACILRLAVSIVLAAVLVATTFPLSGETYAAGTNAHPRSFMSTVNSGGEQKGTDDADTSADSSDGKTETADGQSGGFSDIEKKESDENNGKTATKDSKKPVQSLTCESKDWKITVTCKKEFDADTELAVEELKKDTDLYDKYISESIELTDRAAELTYENALDISLMSGKKAVEPNGPVSVCIELKDSVSDADVIHFEGKKEKPVVAAHKLSGRKLEFETDSFSVFTIISGPKAEREKPDEENTPEAAGIPDEKPPLAQGSVKAKNTGSAAAKGGSRSMQESSHLEDFLINAVVIGATQTAGGVYMVEEGKNYQLICSFAENSSHQFNNNATLVYQMPAGIVIPERQTGTLKINIVYKGKTYQIDAPYVLDTDGSLELSFDHSDPDYPRLTESTNVTFRFPFNAQFDGSETNISFSDLINRELIFVDPEAGQAYATKSATYDEEHGVFNYVITVTSTGEIEDVNVRDIISGNALIFNNDVSISGNSSSYTNNGASNGFDYTFDSMHEGEVITITYSASIDTTKDTDGDGKITAAQTKNTVIAEPEDGDPHSSEYSREITYKYAVKSNGTESGTTQGGDKIIDWSIDYNQFALGVAGGDVITDTIAADSTGYMSYYGTGITVEVRNQQGTAVRTQTIPYQSLTSHSSSAWTYTIPTSDNQPYSYHITYQTVVDMSAVSLVGTAVTLNNTANNSSGSVTVAPADTIHVDKEVEDYTTEEVDWVATLTIPKSGLASAIVTDNLPGRYFDGGFHYDTYKAGSLKITGLLPDEDYQLTVTANAIVINFFYTVNNVRHDGLMASSNDRNIYVKLTTETDQAWLVKGYEEKYLESHVNTINLNGISDTATVIYGKPGIDKTGERIDEDTFLYTVIVDGLKTDQFEMRDMFDTSVLEVDTSKAGQTDHMFMYGGTQWSQISGKTPVTYTDTADGMILTVNNVAKDSAGQYYPFYRISYYLKVKDGVDLDALAKAHAGRYDVTNTATWNGFSDPFTYHVQYDYLDKELRNENELGPQNRNAQYRITFNNSKVTLNNGEPIKMTDILGPNLSLDYGSVNITTEPAGAHVSYTFEGGKDEHGINDGTTVATYMIPDSTKVVVTYDAAVRGNGQQRIENKVTALTIDETVTDTKDYGIDTGGGGAVASFKAIKVDGHDASNKLEGARFRFYAENPNLNFGENYDYAKEIILESNASGEILIDGELFDMYFEECYHLQEIEAPDNYGKISFDYLITLTDDMSNVDYRNFVYYYTDTMQIKNYPLEGLVVEKQVNSSEVADKERYYTFRMSILNSDGTVNTNYNAKNGDDQFTNGVCEFQLKHNEQKMFWGFENGTKYKVEELDGDGFTTTVTYNEYDSGGSIIDTHTDSSTYHSGELTQPEEVIVFTNSKSDTVLPLPTGISAKGGIPGVLIAAAVMAMVFIARRRKLQESVSRLKPF